MTPSKKSPPNLLKKDPKKNKSNEEEEAEEERVAMTEAEEYANAGITKEEAEKTAEEQED